ncbi:MAG: MBL fold metallo-hydrolase [Hellea sp.]|nr:MBL fold metallo-hydrolase [Hellea sp.]
MQKPTIKAFFDEYTNTVSYVVSDPKSLSCAVIDSVLGYDIYSAYTSNESIEKIVKYIHNNNLKTQWILETHAHADHLSGASVLKSKLGGEIAMGCNLPLVQKAFGKIYNENSEFNRNGSQFDRLFNDGDKFQVGTLNVTVMSVPGHTPACVAYYISDALFIGDTLFMPDYGSARCDFPGGDAGTLYESVQRIYQLPGKTRLFLCHDYKTKNRNYYKWETTVDEQKEKNIHLNSSVDKQTFIEMRTKRDKTLKTPKLLLPSIQVNMRAGRLPKAENNGKHYLKIPINTV